MIDLHALSDDEADNLRRAVLADHERRRRLADAPQQVATLAAAYTADGGDPQALVAAITDPPA